MSPTTSDPDRRLAADGAFVVQFLTGSRLDGGAVGGRVEHVASGRTAHFASVDDLLRFFDDILEGLHGTGS